MFKPVGLTQEIKLREYGTLELRTLPVPFLFSQTNYQRSKNVIIYKGSIHDTYPTSLFKCELTTLKKMFIIEKLLPHTSSIMDESSVHFFLGWILEEAVRWAEDAGKDMVVVDTKLPHITEWFVEHNWNFSTSDSMGQDKGYRGTKTVMEVCSK